MRVPLIAVLAIAAATLPAAAKDVRSLHLNYVYYDVAGTTFAEISNDMANKSPPEANGYVSATTYYFEWRRNFWVTTDESGNETCSIYNASVVVDIDVVLPRHPSIDQAPQEVQDIWNRFIAATERHELHHVADFVEVGFGLPDAMNGLSAPGCGAAEAEVNRVGQEFSDRALQLGEDYDVETNHGIKDGAILQ